MCTFISVQYSLLSTVRGMLYSFDNHNQEESVGSVFTNGNWTKIGQVKDFPTDALTPPMPIFAIPYFVRV